MYKETCSRCKRVCSTPYELLAHECAPMNEPEEQTFEEALRKYHADTGRQFSPEEMHVASSFWTAALASREDELSKLRADLEAISSTAAGADSMLTELRDRVKALAEKCRQESTKFSSGDAAALWLVTIGAELDSLLTEKGVTKPNEVKVESKPPTGSDRRPT